MKKTYWLPVLSGIIFCLVYIYAFDSKLDLNGDNANYLRFAQSMAQGHGYSSPSINGPMPASQYPPAYSAFLSVFMRLGIDNLIFFKVLNGLLLAASLFLLYYITLKTTGNRALAFAPTLLVVFCPELQHFANIVMSEMLFLFFTALCFFACYRQSHAERPFWKSPWFYVVILATAGAYYTRTVGMALVLGVLVFYLFRKEWKQALVSLAGIVLLNIPWSVRNAVNGIESRYFGTIMTVNPWRPEEGQIASFGDLFEKMLHNFDETVIKGFKDLLFPFMTVNYDTPSTFPAVIGGLCIVALVFYGAWHMKELRWGIMAYLVGQIGLFMLWHGGNGARYVVPIAPFLYICFYTGLYQVLMLLFGKWSHKLASLPYAFLLVALAMLPPLQQQAQAAKAPYHPAYTNYFTLAKELQKQAPQGTVCCCRKPELFMYYAPKVLATNYKYTTSTDELIQDLLDKQVEFVVLEQLGYGSTYRYLYPAIQQHPDLFPVVWHLPNPDTYLLWFDRTKASEMLTHVEENAQ